MAWNGSIPADWVFRVANFGFNYLRHFSINFQNSCTHLTANFLNFWKHLQHFRLVWFWRELWTKNKKFRNRKNCYFNLFLFLLEGNLLVEHNTCALSKSNGAEVRQGMFYISEFTNDENSNMWDKWHEIWRGGKRGIFVVQRWT